MHYHRQSLKKRCIITKITFLFFQTCLFSRSMGKLKQDMNLRKDFSKEIRKLMKKQHWEEKIRFVEAVKAQKVIGA